MDIIKDIIYLDNSSSTRLDVRVLEAMKPYYFDIYAVATSQFGYSMGIEAKEAVEYAREKIAEKIGAKPDEIVFTSGDAESDNLAIKGVLSAHKNSKKRHFITSAVEDFSVLNTFKNIADEFNEVSFLKVDKNGFIDIEELRDLIRDDTILVSIQHANQEIGTVQNIEQISKVCKEKKVIFHTDATHTFTRIPLNVSNIKADLITLSAHTIHGPRGVGALYVRKGTKIVKQMDGGYQENNLRGGIENIPGMVGFAKAVELVTEDENEKLKQMREYLINKIFEDIPDVILNGDRVNRIPQNVNISFKFVEGESLTLHLDMRGISVSTGSACFSRSLEASHVILGIGGNHERAHGSVRFTFGRFNNIEEVEKIVKILKDIVSRLRKISPLGKAKD